MGFPPPPPPPYGKIPFEQHFSCAGSSLYDLPELVTPKIVLGTK